MTSLDLSIPNVRRATRCLPCLGAPPTLGAMVIDSHETTSTRQAPWLAHGPQPLGPLALGQRSEKLKSYWTVGQLDSWTGVQRMQRGSGKMIQA